MVWLCTPKLHWGAEHRRWSAEYGRCVQGMNSTERSRRNAGTKRHCRKMPPKRIDALSLLGSGRSWRPRQRMRERSQLGPSTSQCHRAYIFRGWPLPSHDIADLRLPTLNPAPAGLLLFLGRLHWRPSRLPNQDDMPILHSLQRCTCLTEPRATEMRLLPWLRR